MRAGEDAPGRALRALPTRCTSVPQLPPSPCLPAPAPPSSQAWDPANTSCPGPPAGSRQALRRNPFAPEVPCHRVIAASLELGGWGGVGWVGRGAGGSPVAKDGAVEGRGQRGRGPLQLLRLRLRQLPAAPHLHAGGFSGSWGVGCANVVKKRRLLAEEGVAFDDAGKLLTAAAVMDAGRLRAAAEAAGVL